MFPNIVAMQALGNSFIILPDPQNILRTSLTPATIRTLAKQHNNCDQILLLEPTSDPQTLRYSIFNRDGSEVGQCVNGVRCAAWWAYQNGWCHHQAQFETTTTTLQTKILSDNWVEVQLPSPKWHPEAIPLNQHQSCQFTEQSLNWHCINVGNPHTVAAVNYINDYPLKATACYLQSLDLFPEGINVGIMQINTPNHINLRVYERGVGETQACGSGACAAAAIGWQDFNLNSPLTVTLPGGNLTIRGTPDSHLLLTGPAYMR